MVSINNAEEIKSYFYHDKCDKNDYLLAVGCGAIAGVIDIFLVETPAGSKLLSWTDEQVDKAVMKFAKISGWSPREGKENNVASAIGYLERRFSVNYDQRHSRDVNNALSMSTKNHHMKSLSHSPDIIGLFFSILNQFTSTSSFLSNGELITIKTESFELQGNNIASKLFCGVANWLGHIMSDVAGSSGATGRGSGIVIPFYELFSLCNFGSFQVGKDRNTLATLATKVFEEGYDARFGITLTIPVFICDLSVKLIWAVKRYFYHKKPIAECIPSKRHDDLRMMLIIADETLCVMDVADAAIKSKGDWLKFFLHLNIIAWYRLVAIVFREVCIRVGISTSLQKQLDAYVRINEALAEYLKKLEKLDIEGFSRETEQYNEFTKALGRVENEDGLKLILRKEYERLELNLPYEGDFDSFMSDRNNKLVFE